jgi:hypothetical protein
MDDVSSGRLKIPQFQREFVWDIKKSAELLDSVVKGYPIGTFIFWKTRERLRSIRNIGGLVLPDPPKGDLVNFVLDGQQRITSLFAAFKGEKIAREGKTEDFSEIYIDLDSMEDEKIVTTEIEEKEKDQIIKLRDLLYGGLVGLTKYPQKYHDKLDEYKTRIEKYNYSVIQVNEVPIDVATEIFTRINVGGKPLTLFEIMVAKTYDVESDFDLAQKYSSLIDSLRNVNYETVSDATVLQVVSLILKNECQRKNILNIDKKDFIATWPNAVDAIENAVDYFIGYYGIPVSRLLPYNALIAPFAYFFYNHKDRPVGDKQRYLQDFFWRVALSGRYSSGVEGKLAQDVKRIDKILKGELPDYDWPINNSPEFIFHNGWFSAGRSFVKAILCIYANNQPKSFIDNSSVRISNYWLKQANSKNYHHFFPRAYLEKKNIDERYINNILNITIVDDFLNKRAIRDNPPSKYMENFKRVNSNLTETMKTHLITNLDDFGVWTDNYVAFINKRGEEVSKAIESRIIKQEIDKKAQPDLIDDSGPEIELS